MRTVEQDEVSTLMNEKLRVEKEVSGNIAGSEFGKNGEETHGLTEHPPAVILATSAECWPAPMEAAETKGKRRVATEGVDWKSMAKRVRAEGVADEGGMRGERSEEDVVDEGQLESRRNALKYSKQRQQTLQKIDE